MPVRGGIVEDMSANTGDAGVLKKNEEKERLGLLKAEVRDREIYRREEQSAYDWRARRELHQSVRMVEKRSKVGPVVIRKQCCLRKLRRWSALKRGVFSAWGKLSV